MMGDTAFTPGPWVAEIFNTSAEARDGGDFRWWGAAMEARLPVGSVWLQTERGGTTGLPGRIETTAANAHLIAAAPDLYEALEEAFSLIGAPRDFSGLEDDDSIEHCIAVRIGFVKKLQSALTKARGEVA